MKEKYSYTSCVIMLSCISFLSALRVDERKEKMAETIN